MAERPLHEASQEAQQVSACYPGMFADLSDEELMNLFSQCLTSCEESELANEARRRGLL